MPQMHHSCIDIWKRWSIDKLYHCISGGYHSTYTPTTHTLYTKTFKHQQLCSHYTEAS